MSPKRILLSPEEKAERATKEYRTWSSMISRCNAKNPRTMSYKNYSSRGIKVCKRWLNFENFINDMGEAPTPAHSIDRINVNGHYEPRNCRWATRRIQNGNRRQSVLITYNGETHCLAEWARKLDISLSALRGRYRKRWDIQILFSPLKRIRKPATYKK